MTGRPPRRGGRVALFITTSAVGGGKRFFPDDALLDPEPVEERARAGGPIRARHRTR
ncbi:hypothetical protein [Streptomyces sp. NPDC020330]|uniref:hypothetical protein n=1 Tax=unclassified Streptomyces TaxID=2593676 RepID=UPI00379A0922